MSALLLTILGSASAGLVLREPVRNISEIQGDLSKAISPTCDRGESSADTEQANIVLAAAKLVPGNGETVVAHSAHAKLLDLLDRAVSKGKQRTMVLDLTALVWNWDTYAIVNGKPTPVVVEAKDLEELAKHIHLGTDANGKMIVQEGALIAKTSTGFGPTWMPGRAVLESEEKILDENANVSKMIFTFSAPVDPNNDRLEVWEIDVAGEKQYLTAVRAAQVSHFVRMLMRFLNLDRVIAWDLSWGTWDVVPSGTVDGDGQPNLVVNGKAVATHAEITASVGSADAFNQLAEPVAVERLREHLQESAGYYLLGGNTYTMSLWHNMWNKQPSGGHKAVLGELVKSKDLFYMGHSAGAIMTGPSIITATMKGIDSFSIGVQPCNKPFVRLPPSETAESFFYTGRKDDSYLLLSRKHMLKKMEQNGGWSGFGIVEVLIFPHYDARPTFKSFPQSAETYLRATSDAGEYKQEGVSFALADGNEPENVRALRLQTNAQHIPVVPIANGHAVGLTFGGKKVSETFSPEEEGQSGALHFDTYLPPVKMDEEWTVYAPGQTKFAKGEISDAGPAWIPGDRTNDMNPDENEYNGCRIVSRLEALGLPAPSPHESGMFRDKK